MCYKKNRSTLQSYTTLSIHSDNDDDGSGDDDDDDGEENAMHVYGHCLSNGTRDREK